jgi:dCMP deaminase
VIIGLTGKYAAGKGTAAEVLMELGYGYHSLSDILRDELKTRGVAESREALLGVGNELRRADGPGALAKRLLPKLEEGLHLVDSIRNPVEVHELRTLPKFILIGIDAESKVRFERLRNRNRQGDPETWEKFVELESRELQSDDPAAQQLLKTFELSDHVLNNDGTIAVLREAILNLLEDLGVDTTK